VYYCVETTSYNTTTSRRSLYQSETSPTNWLIVDGLLAFTEYLIQVNASNSRGFVLSNVVTVVMPPDGHYCYRYYILHIALSSL